MKKTYLAPVVEVMNTEVEELLAGSVTSDKGIGYGGVDTAGDMDPASRSVNSWDDEEQ